MITLNEVLEAQEEIRRIIHKTPILTSTLLDERCENHIYLKAEHLQKTGSFKIRGAANKVKQAVEKGAQFITAASSGNHGQAVAYMAGKLQVPAVIVVPTDANPVKVAAIESYGAQIEYCGTTSSERIPRAKELAAANNGVFIPPYDDPYVMAGQGTCGLEILEQVQNLDVVVVPVGGGGLISGILTAVKESNPSVKVIGVEPEIANDTYLSLQAQKITAISSTTTIADGLRTSQPGDLTFPIVMKYLDELVLVSEAEIREAVQFLAERAKQLVEPSGATALAAVLAGKLRVTDQHIAVVLSGGNMDLHRLPEFLPAD